MATVVKIEGPEWFEQMASGIEKFGRETGNKTFMVGPPRADAVLQTQIIENLIARGVDALAVVPFSPETLEPVLKKAMDRGIVVVTHEASNQQNRHYDLEAFPNDVNGVSNMDRLAECMGGEGEYAVFVGNLSSRTHNEWVDAAIAHQRESYPGMKWVGSKNESYDDEQTAYQKAHEMLQTFPGLKGFLGSAGLDVIGIGRQIEERKLEHETCVVGTSLPALAGRYLESNAVDTISFWEPAHAGFAMNQVALRVLQGEEIVTGDDLGAPGYESVKVDGSVIYGTALLHQDAP